jgi:ribosome-associated protein
MKATASQKPTKPASKPRKSGAKAIRAKPSHRLLTLIVKALEEKKADDLRVLDVSKASSITDYLILATGNSEPHLRALRIEVERVLDAEKAKILGVDTTQGSGWCVVDAFEVMVHLFSRENRGKYRMEQLWKDAIDLPISKLI